ncbi:type II toxin-antitoxin system RelE/ParE family toxin [Rhodopseudomonas sp. BR0M22]|uniref:type II toxin-antitoxin system RelE/ParE family toxin n=1 Tax=Rhodopseudomonas sp. BR0M22 TaxID=2269369 RepID=UPI0013DFA0E4|nr:type II toxin-antitoxin system RelE/ParE family toxin [Rhodopseudomonas sp. BR0M22]MCD0422565.1 type II toxin-antitoxin system RelE/ParE family toxin [Rubrivivax sp. JA1024]NEW92165.1 type II toxin-antitoxin system RelE/ParE family toxin [Rhodopseudomonas sp. BR0M22]
MKVVYSRQALADLDQISAYYGQHASPRVARSIGARIENVIARIASAPNSAPKVTQRPDIRSAAVVRYPFRVFYRVRDSKIEILHIRHTARAPMRQSD